MSKPLLIDLFCGLGGWTRAFLDEGWECIGFDIERHDYGTGGYPGQLVLQDVCTLEGSQLAHADCIVASSPCQEFSYRAMPWKRAKALGPPVLGIKLFWQAFRLQREIELATGRRVPLIAENVCGAQKWVGSAAWHFGSFYLWGDVPALMPTNVAIKNGSLGGGSWFGISATNTVLGMNPDGRRIAHAAKQLDGRHANGERNDPRDAHLKDGRKGPGGDWFKDGRQGQDACVEAIERRIFPDSGTKVSGDWFGSYADMKAAGTISPGRLHGKGSKKRAAASAMIAMIPYPLAQHIARVYKPDCRRTSVRDENQKTQFAG